LLLFVVPYRIVFALLLDGAIQANIKKRTSGNGKTSCRVKVELMVFRSVRHIRAFDRCQEMAQDIKSSVRYL
jgi:hypothetical protein